MTQQERENISRLIRSTESHELGVLLAYEHGYDEKYNWNFRIDYWCRNVKYIVCHPNNTIYEDDYQGGTLYMDTVEIRLGKLYIAVCIPINSDWGFIRCSVNYDNIHTYETRNAKFILDENLKDYLNSVIIKRDSTVEMLFHEVLRVIKNNQKQFQNLIDQPCKNNQTDKTK